MRLYLIAMALGLVLAAPASAKGHEGSPSKSMATTRAGDIAFANSGSKAGQAPFLEGLALLHNFEYARAAESFRRAEEIDPRFVMAYWGEAMTHNHAVWMQQDLVAARAALSRLGATPEQRRSRSATTREKDYLAAVEVLYGEGTKEQRDFRYSDALAVLHDKYPGDADATAFYALSILGTCHEGRDFARYMKAAALLEPLYPTHLRHPGILHYLIHSYDDPVHAPLGLRAAGRYGAIAPDAPHAMHMTSHIFLALGMWDEVISSNVNAMRVVNEIAARKQQPARTCGHYMIWLMYGYLQEGRNTEAANTLAGCRATAAASVSTDKQASFELDNSDVGSWAYMRLLQIVETGRDEPLGPLPLQGTLNASPDFFATYADAIAALRGDDLPALKSSQARLDDRKFALLTLMDTQAGASPGDRGAINVIASQITSVLHVRMGDVDAGLAELRKTAQNESALPVQFGPPVIALPSWELLGEELVRAGKFEEATTAFRKALAAAPGRTRALRGLLQAQENSGDAAAAAATRLELGHYPRASTAH